MYSAQATCFPGSTRVKIDRIEFRKVAFLVSTKIYNLLHYMNMQNLGVVLQISHRRVIVIDIGKRTGRRCSFVNVRTLFGGYIRLRRPWSNDDRSRFLSHPFRRNGESSNWWIEFEILSLVEKDTLLTLPRRLTEE